MRRFFPLAVLVFLTILSFKASAAGVIVDTIKAHVEQHQTLPVAHHQTTVAPRTALEQWVRSLLDSLASSR